MADETLPFAEKVWVALLRLASLLYVALGPWFMLAGAPEAANDPMREHPWLFPLVLLWLAAMCHLLLVIDPRTSPAKEADRG